MYVCMYVCMQVYKYVFMRKEKYNQDEINHMFNAIVLPNVLYGLSVYGASDSDLSLVQRFLKRWHKRHFISYLVDIFSPPESQHRSILQKLIV